MTKEELYRQKYFYLYKEYPESIPENLDEELLELTDEILVYQMGLMDDL